MKVKPLEWSFDGATHKAKIFAGLEYHLWKLSNGWFLGEIPGERYPRTFGRGGFESLDEAKAAAQSHFEKQIMSVIVQDEGGE